MKSRNNQNVDELIKSYVRRDRAHDTRRAKMDAEIERLEKEVYNLEDKRSKIGYVSWIDAVVQPLADALGDHYDRQASVLGPFGLNAETSIHLYKRGVSDKERFDGDNCISITFRPEWIYSRDHRVKSFELRVVDYSKNTGRYPEGSIGEMNGGNYDTIPLPKTLKGIIKLIDAQNKPKVERGSAVENRIKSSSVVNSAAKGGRGSNGRL